MCPGRQSFSTDSLLHFLSPCKRKCLLKVATASVSLVSCLSHDCALESRTLWLSWTRRTMSIAFNLDLRAWASRDFLFRTDAMFCVCHLPFCSVNVPALLNSPTISFASRILKVYLECPRAMFYSITSWPESAS